MLALSSSKEEQFFFLLPQSARFKSRELKVEKLGSIKARDESYF